MEFPGDVTTNIYRLGNIEEVQYSIYTSNNLKDGALSATAIESGTAKVDAELMIQARTQLEEASVELRNHGFCVYFDHAELALWLFHVRPNKSETESADRLLLGVLQSRNLHSIWSLSPKIKSADYKKARFRSAISCANAIKSLADAGHAAIAPEKQEPEWRFGVYASVDNQTFDFNKNIDQSRRQQHVDGEYPGDPLWKGPATDDRKIYQRLMSALSTAILSTLSLAGVWYSLGSRISLRAAPAESLIGDSSYGNRNISMLKIAVEWQSNASLVISVYPSSAAHVRQLSDSRVSISKNIGCELVMAPSGLIATLVGYESGTSDDWKQNVTEKLSRLNIAVPVSTLWISLLVHAESRIAPIAWPSHLCFFLLPQKRSSEQGCPFLEAASDPLKADPLARVEQWYAERHSRANALAAYKQSEIISAQNELNEDEEDDELTYLNDIGQGNTQGFQQDLSGVYPTPPDGPPFNTQSQSVSHFQHGEEPGKDRATAPSFPIQTESSGENIAAIEGFCPPNRASNTDLFGDMDTEFLGGNDLTEADFNFFDEPSDDGQDHTKIEQDGLMSSITSPMTNSAWTADDATLDVDMAEAPDLQNQETAPRNNPNMNNVNTFNMTGEHQKHDMELTEPEKPPLEIHDFRPTSHGSLGDFARPNDGQQSTTSLPLEASLRVFDFKYAGSGRFHVDLIDEPKSEQPGDPFSEVQYEVPRLSAQQRSECRSSSDPNDDGDDNSDDHVPPLNDEAEVRNPPTLTLKRKHDDADDSDHQVTSQHPLSPITPAFENREDSTSFISSELCTQYLGNGCEGFLSQVPSEHIAGPSNMHYLSELEFLRLAQVYADQIILHNDDLMTTSKSLAKVPMTFEANESTSGIPEVTAAILHVIDDAVQLGLKELAQSSDELIGPRASKNLEPRQQSSQAEGINGPFSIEAPLVSIRRGSGAIELDPSALAFWEELALEPFSSVKDVDYICLCPLSTLLESRLVAFLDGIGSAYQNCKFGVHKPWADRGHRNGIVSLGAEGLRNVDDILIALDRACEKLGQQQLNGLHAKVHELIEAGQSLSRSGATSKTFVIYIIDLFESTSVLPLICQAFLKLFDSYASGLRESQPANPNDLALQVIPLAMFASTQHLVIPEPAAYRKMALEVYSRCAPTSQSSFDSPFNYGPPIQLAKNHPPSINFKLTSKPSVGLPLGDRCIHVSYCCPAQSAWLTASWTNNQGSHQWNTSYYLGDNPSGSDEQWPDFDDVAKDMWQITMSMAGSIDTPYRIFIIKSDLMTQAEIQEWAGLAENSRFDVHLTLLSLNSNPELQLYTGPRTLPWSAVPPDAPITSNFSPDQPSNAATPAATLTGANPPTPTSASFESDPRARLVDITDQTWGLVMAQQSEKTEQLPPPLCSGYMIKRRGPKIEDGLLSCEFHLMYAEGAPGPLVKEVLSMYRCLGLLARARAIVYPVKSVLPWHVAAAIKAHAALEATMRWKNS